MRNKILIVYPHGLGDIILLTPTLFAMRDREVHVAVLKRFDGTEILDACPYATPHYILSDPWNECSRASCRMIGNAFGHSIDAQPFWVWHNPHDHKILYNFRALGANVCGADDMHTHVYITPQHQNDALEWIDGADLAGKPFVFIHADTGMPGKTNVGGKKDFNSVIASSWAMNRWPDLRRSVVVGESFKKTSMPLPVQFAIMRHAGRRVLADSVFYHAAHAMDLCVDFAYFGRGKGVYERVRPLHDSMEYVSWTPMTLPAQQPS